MKIRISKHLAPERVLHEFDGPKIFTTRDDDGDLLLVYQCGESDSGDVFHYLVVPFDDAHVADLTEGRMPILEALTQPWLSVASGHIGNITGLRACSMTALPDFVSLPHHGAMLWSSLEPLISLRQIGDGITKGEVPAVVARQGISGPSSALAGIAEYIEDTMPAMAECLAPLKDAKVQRITYASFDIGISAKLPEAATEPMNEVKRLLSAALHAAADADGDKALGDYFQSDYEGKAILKVVRDLTPMLAGPVTDTRVGGRLVRGGRIIGLTRKSRQYIQERCRPTQDQIERFPSFTGRIGEVDKDNGSFMLRDINGPDREKKIWFGQDHEDEILRFLDLSASVVVEAIVRPNRSLKLMNIKESSSPKK